MENNKVSIGGSEYEISPLTFKRLKAAWPLIKENQAIAKQAKEDPESIDPIRAMEVGIGIVACGLSATHPEMTPEKIEEVITTQECQLLNEVIVEIMIQSGFMQRTDEESDQGEEAPARGEDAEQPTSLTETSTAS